MRLLAQGELGHVVEDPVGVLVVRGLRDLVLQTALREPQHHERPRQMADTVYSNPGESSAAAKSQSVNSFRQASGEKTRWVAWLSPGKV